MKRFLLAGALGGFLWGCGQGESSVAMGPGSETSGIAVRLENSDGSPAVKVCVKAVAVDGWATGAAQGTAILDSGATDDSGRVRIASFPGRRVALEAELGSAVVRRELRGDSVDSERLVLRNGGMLLLRLDDNVGIDRLLLQGTTLATSVQGDGNWVFPWVPQGRYTVVARKAGVLVPFARVDADSLRRLDTSLSVSPMVLLDDFETDTVRNLVGQRLGGGAWFSRGRGGDLGQDPVSPPALATAREPGWEGKSLHVQLQVGVSEDSAREAMLGMDLAESPDGKPQVWRDLTRADSLSFRTRGRGHVWVRFLTAFSSDSCTYEASLELPSTWTGATVPLDSVRVSASSCPSWEAARRKVAGIGFVAHRDAELWLDDLALHGILPGDLFPGYAW